MWGFLHCECVALHNFCIMFGTVCCVAFVLPKIAFVRTQGLHFGTLGVHLGDPGLFKKSRREPLIFLLYLFDGFGVSPGDHFEVISMTFPSFEMSKREVRLRTFFLCVFGVEKTTPAHRLYIVKTYQQQHFCAIFTLSEYVVFPVLGVTS